MLIDINGESVVIDEFKQDFGDIMGIAFVFDGTGSVDHVRMQDSTGKHIFEEGFEQ